MNDWDTELKVSHFFTPASPVNQHELFAGRIEQVRKVVDVINQQGQHGIIYGERGVGKTSLAQILPDVFYHEGGAKVLTAHVNCDGGDTFASVWRKVFGQIGRAETVTGFQGQTAGNFVPLSEQLPERPTTADIRRLLDSTPGTVIIIDEFDRIQAGRPSQLFADLIKGLSDFGTAVTVILVGVADSIEQLITDHASVERCIAQIVMPRMSHEELEEIITKRLPLAGMSAAEDVAPMIAQLSQGFPHYTHLLGLHSARQALNNKRKNVQKDDVHAAIASAVDQAGASIQTAYQKAVISSRSNALFEQVLLACALASPDDLGYFAAVDVRQPMSDIMGRRYDIPSFAQHLSRFCETERGNVLERIGTRRRYRYRFTNPMIRPYVYLRGHKMKKLPAGYALN